MLRTPAVIDALIASFAAEVDTVYDGPTLPEVWPGEFVVVGGTEEADTEGASSTSEWRGLGANARQETGGIT